MTVPHDTVRQLAVEMLFVCDVLEAFNGRCGTLMQEYYFGKAWTLAADAGLLDGHWDERGFDPDDDGARTKAFQRDAKAMADEFLGRTTGNVVAA